MKIQLLGTGSADGWPNPFCECESCATQRVSGKARASSAALIDDSVLIDWGPTLGHNANLHGVSMRNVQHIFFTHGHPDHLAPDFLLWRSWISDLSTLHIWGPPMAIARFEHWVMDDAPVSFHIVAPGDECLARTAAGNVVVQVLEAAHGHGNGDVFADEAVLYDITSVDGDRLLYASDTGPLKAYTVADVADREFNVVLIEETFGFKTDHNTGHHDLSTLPTTLQQLRDARAVTASTDVIAFHLSHHNPPTQELALELAKCGARVVDDGTVINTRTSRTKKHLILGGARSGKSRYAEQRARNLEAVTYVATGGVRADDAEWNARVALHQERRPQHWLTIESTDLVGVIAQATSPLLIDCLTMWLTAKLDEADAWNADQTVHAKALHIVHMDIDALVHAVQQSPVELILVSNEVGQGIVPDTASGRLFRDLMGIVNARIAEVCTEAVFVIAGKAIPLQAIAPLLTKESL